MDPNMIGLRFGSPGYQGSGPARAGENAGEVVVGGGMLQCVARLAFDVLPESPKWPLHVSSTLSSSRQSAHNQTCGLAF